MKSDAPTNKRRLTISMTERIAVDLERLAKEKGFTKSAIITLALEEFVKKNSKKG